MALRADIYRLIEASAVTFPVLLALLGLYVIYGGIYRLYFHPLSRFPGPKLAALSLWYEFYYDVLLKGRYTLKIRELHKEYGPIIRISPHELHISDPSYLSTLYPGPSRKTDKYPWALRSFGNDDNTFSTVGHSHHRIRRSAISPFFSHRSVEHLQSQIQPLVKVLYDRFEEKARLNEPIELMHAYSALTMDVITTYCLGQTNDCLNSENFGADWYDMLCSLLFHAHLLKQFPLLYTILLSCPLWLLRAIKSPMLKRITLQTNITAKILSIKQGKQGKQGKNENVTVFEELLRSSLPAEEKTVSRLAAEARALIAAGTLTTAHTIATTTFHILSSPSILATLLTELRSATPNTSSPPTWHHLSTLPYLTAIINEGLRVGFGISHRLQRVAPDTDLVYKQWLIPRGTPVGMSSALTHMDEALFEQPERFWPERWLDDSHGGDKAKLKAMKDALVSFGKGTRACPGRELALAEMYLALAGVVGKFGERMQVWETVRERDVDMARDFFAPFAEEGSKGVRVVIHEEQG